MSSSSNTAFSPIPIFHGLRVIKQSKTPITELSPHRDLPSGITPSTWYWEVLYPITSFLAWSAIFLLCQVLTVLHVPYARSNFRRWTKLTSIFLIFSFHLKQQAWLRACVESVVLIAFHFVLPFLLDGIFIESLDKICRDHHQHFCFFRDVNWIHV